MELKTRNARLRAERREAGLCTRCGKHPPKPGRVDCRACCRYKSDQTLARFDTRKANGLCVACGVVPVVRFTNCRGCREAASERFKARYRAMSPAERLAYNTKQRRYLREARAAAA